MTTDSIVVVCTGNICRSPVGEALLAHALSGTAITVSSAGTRAILGQTPAPQALDFIEITIGEQAQNKGRQLTKEVAEAADLILTMTAEQRAWVTRLAPRTVRRTYTLLEYSRLLTQLDEKEEYTSLPDLVQASAPLRGAANAQGAPNDIMDPYNGTIEDYSMSFDHIAKASYQIAIQISEHLVNISTIPGSSKPPSGVEKV